MEWIKHLLEFVALESVTHLITLLPMKTQTNQVPRARSVLTLAQASFLVRQTVPPFSESEGAGILAELLEFTERYVLEMGFKAERNGGTLTGAEWYDLKRAKDTIARATEGGK